MCIIPIESEMENVRCDLVRNARHGNIERIVGAAVILKRIGCRDLVHILRDYTLDRTNWHYDGTMIPEDANAYRIINENFR